jgi:tetratricopeptide (TPR) repeat protein
MTTTLTDTLYKADAATIREAQRRAEDRGDYPALALAQDALAHHLWRRGELREARRVLNAGIALLAVEFIRERLMLSNTLILIELASGRFERVCELAPRAIADAELLDDKYLRGQAHGHFGNALAQIGETDRAFYHLAAAHFYFGGDPKQQAATDNNTAYLLIQSGRPEDALFYLDRARIHYEEAENFSALGQVCETRARAFVAMKQFRAAKDVINESLDLIPTHERLNRAESVRTKGLICSELGETEEAGRCYLEAIELLAL